MFTGEPPPDNLALKLYVNGRIRTAYDGSEPVPAMATIGGVVAAVGTEDEARAALPPNPVVVDIDGRCLVPGLVDVHTHIVGNALYNLIVECRDTVDPTADSVAELMRRIAEAADRSGPGELVIGVGAMSQNARLTEHRWPTLEEMDAAAPANPAYIMFGSHITVANSRALAMGGINDDTADPEGGKIDRDPRTRHATGVLRETAKRTVIKDLVDHFGFETYLDTVEAVLRRVAATGITTIHDIVSTRAQLRAYQELQARGRLPVRVMFLIRVVEGDFGLESLPDLALSSGFGNDMLWFGGAKISLDGATSSRSAAFTEDLPDHPKDGLLRIRPEMLEAAIKAHHEAGVRMCIHALGDGAVDHTIAAFDKAGVAGSGMRHRIEHFGNWLVTDERLERCRRLGVTPVPNPAFVRFLGDDHLTIMGGLDSPYAERFYPFKTLADQGFALAGGSDAPGFFPVGGMRDVGLMANRVTSTGQVLDPAENLSLEQALRAQTATAAWLGLREHRAGKLAPGYDADFLILDCEDILEVAPKDLERVVVLQAVVAGRVAAGAHHLMRPSEGDSVA